MARSQSGLAALATCAVALTALSSRVAAHDPHTVGPYRLEIGWSEEPAFAGIRNAIVVEVTEAKGGGPVSDLDGGSLSAGSRSGRAHGAAAPPAVGPPTNSEPSAHPHPRRHVCGPHHGRIKAQPIDITSDVLRKRPSIACRPSEIQFPPDPSAGHLVERIDRAMPRAEQALDAAARARTTGLAAIGVSILALWRRWLGLRERQVSTRPRGRLSTRAAARGWGPQGQSTKEDSAHARAGSSSSSSPSHHIECARRAAGSPALMEGVALGDSPATIQLTMAERPEVSLSSIQVADVGGVTYEIGRPVAVSDDPMSIAIPVRRLGTGVYTVRWRVVSAIDGHATGGAYAFGVRASPAAASPTNILPRPPDSDRRAGACCRVS